MESAHRCVCKLPLVSAFISKMCEIKPRMHLSLQTATYTLLIRGPPPTIYQLPPRNLRTSYCRCEELGTRARSARPALAGIAG